MWIIFILCISKRDKSLLPFASKRAKSFLPFWKKLVYFHFEAFSLVPNSSYFILMWITFIRVWDKSPTFCKKRYLFALCLGVICPILIPKRAKSFLPFFLFSNELRGIGIV
jgi:hypothetical protein